MPLPLIMAAIGLALVGGILAGYYLRYIHALSKKSSLELQIKERIITAEERAIQIIEKAEKEAQELKRETKEELKAREDTLVGKENRLAKREELLDTRQIDIDSQIENVRNKIEEIKTLKEQLDVKKAEAETTLAHVAGLTKEEAFARIAEQIEKERADDLVGRIRKLDMQQDEVFEEKALNLLLAAMHRVGNTMPPATMTAHVELPSEDMKGKIIGKEGRNVRSFERMTGVDVLIDDMPGYIVLSSFDPLRREIARVALEVLLKDGRIQPARIEEVVEQARKDVGQTLKKMGEKAAYEAGVHNLHPELLGILGRLHFRTSYGQNVLWHSVEMAHMAGIIATEIGADAGVARAGALLHDIGKAVSHEVAGTHVEIGRHILMKYDVDEAVIKAMQAHHEEYPYETPESIIVQVVDAISGGRPGARRDSIENYIKRLEDLEAIAVDMPGVDKAYAISAGREIRIFVNPESLSELQVHALARDVATNIETQLRYPGEIKVHVIRETRVVSYAR